MDHLTIGQLAKQGGVNLETIRYRERRGLRANRIVDLADVPAAASDV